MTGTEQAVAKLQRWISKRPNGWSRREAFMGTKGGAMRTVEDFDAALALLLDQGDIALADEQPSRGVRYVTRRSNEFAAPSSEPPSVEAPAPTANPPKVPSVATSPEPEARVDRTADEVIASAAAKRSANPANWIGRGCLEAIERRYGKTAGDTLRGSDLHPVELANLIRAGA